MKDYPITERQAQEMFEAHSSYIYGIALMITKQRALADDVTQETFLRAFAKYHLYDSSRPLRPWLYRIAVNMSRNLLRRKVWIRLLAGVPREETEHSAENFALQNENRLELWNAVSGLSVKLREVITLHYYAELPLPETAEVLGIPLGTCKSRLHAALRKLRGCSELEPGLLTMKEGIK
ncbi:RNA polymerase sigma factor [Paenibacillus tritici]|uniref:RNA polymerase sigma factor n=1 Tax=Paenibacillus tritici TaxID=1873425 RepID=UPI001FE5629F|nr:sigma-70 family RNA polymerase sigma factor [Paenibacillus tritici]